MSCFLYGLGRRNRKSQGNTKRLAQNACIGKRKLTPVAGHGWYSQLAMVSLRAGFSPLFVCLRTSRSVLAPPRSSTSPDRQQFLRQSREQSEKPTRGLFTLACRFIHYHGCAGGCRFLHSATARNGRFRLFVAGAAALVTSGENPLNLTKTKRSRIGFKAGRNRREG